MSTLLPQGTASGDRHASGALNEYGHQHLTTTALTEVFGVGTDKKLLSMER